MTKKNWIATGILIFASFLVYGVAVKNPYYFDDEVVLQNNPDLETSKPTDFYKSFSINKDYGFTGYRPTLMASYWANIKLLGKTPSSIRLGNILLHTTNALLWVAILFQLTGNIWPWKWKWWAGAVFLLHPIQTLAINFLWKRSTLLETFFILLAMLLHSRERNRQRPYRWKVILVQILVFLLAVTSKESAIVLAGFLLLIDVCFYRTTIRWCSRFFSLYGLLGTTTVFYYYARIHWIERWLQPNLVMELQRNSRDTNAFHYFSESLVILPHYFLLGIFPKPLLFDDPLYFQSGWMVWVAASILLFLISGIVFVRLRTKPLLVFLIGLIWISLFPTISFIPIRYSMDQVRMYFPIAGLSGLLVLIYVYLDRYVQAKRIISYASMLMIVLYGGTTIIQNLRYRKPTFIYNDVAQAYPNSGVAWSHLAISYDREGFYPQALKSYQMAIAVEPTPDLVLQEKIYELRFIHDANERKKITSMLDVANVDVSSLMNLIWNEIEWKDYEMATFHLQEAQKRFPAVAQVHLALATLWERTGAIENARKAYANTLQLDPRNTDAMDGQKRIGRPALN